MAYMQLVRKWGIPVATAAAIPIITPVVCADSGEKDVLAPTSRMVRPSDLPIYEEPEEVLDFEYHGKERTFLEENVGVVRKEIERVLDATRSVRERAVDIYETGKAHTMASVDLMKDLRYSGATVDYITDEENMLPRAGAITVGGLAGLVIGARKKGGFFKKVLYTSTGIVSAASLCYPRQAYQISQNVYGNAKDYATIGYNFVAGVKPQSKLLTQAEPKKVPVASTVQDVAPEPTVEEVPPATSAPTTEPEGAEVRSVMPQVTYHKKLPTPIDTLAQQASDVTLWGFRLIDRSSTGSRSPTELVVPAKPSVPEGFGSVEETNKETNKVAVESTAEVVGKEVCLPENVANIENEKTENSHVEDNVHFVAEKVADFVEEKAAGVVIEAAKEVEKDASKVAATAEVVEELGSKVGPVLNVVKNVSEAAVKAAHYTPGVPEPIIDKVEFVTEIVEEAGKVVDNFTSIAESVEEIAKEVKREAEEIESQASEVKRSEKKREEIFEKVIDFVKGTESPSSDEVKETSLKLPDIQDKAQLQELGAEIISEEPAGHLKFSNTDKKDQIPVQKPESEIKDTSYLDTEVKGLAPESSGEPKSSSDIEKKVDSRTGGLVIQKEPVVNIEPGSPVKKRAFYKIINFFSNDKDSLVVEQVEDFSVKKVKEPSIDSGVITESDAPLPEVTPEAALQSGEANMKVNGSKIFSAPAVTKLSDDEAVPDSIGEVLQPVIEGIADDALETVSEAVKEAARDVQEAVSDVVDVTDIVEDVGQKIVTVLDTIQEATEDIQKIPGISESVAFKAKVVNEVSEQVETVVEAVTFVAETVEDIAEMIKKEAIEIENQAVELMQSEKKRDELIESIIDCVTGNESSSTGEIKGEFLQLPAGDLKIQSSEATTEIIKELPQEVNTQEEPEEILAYVAPVEVLEAPKDTVLEPVVKNSLFDKLVNIFSKDDEHKDKPAAGGNSVDETRAEPVEEEFNETIIKHDTESNKIEKIKEPSTGNKIVADGKGLIDKLTSPFYNHKGEEITESVMNVKELPSDLPGTEVKEQVIEEVKKSDIYTPTFKEEKRGVFDKLADFLAKGKEANVLSETMELPAGEERENVEKLPMDAINETAKDTSAESSLIVKPISSADQPKATNVLQIFSISQDEAASSADTAPEVAVVADTQAAAAAVVPHVDLSEEAQLKLNMKTKKQWPDPVVLEKQPEKTNLPVLAGVKPTMDTLPSGSDKKGLFDKLINFVFKDEEKKAAAAVEDAFEDQGIPVVDGIQSAEKANKSSTDTELNEQTVSSKETLNNILSGKQSSAFIKHPENKPLMYKIAEVFSDETEPISVPPEDVAESFNANKSLADVLPDNAPTLKAEDSQIQSNFVIVSSEEDVEGTPISDSAIPSLVEVPKLPSESSLSVPSNTEEPVLEVKDKSLFGRLAELMSVDDKKTVLVPTDVTQVKLEPENLPQKEKNNQNIGKPNADSVDILKDSKSSFKNRVANIFTKNKSPKEDSVQSDKKMQVFEQSKMTIVDSDNIFVVKTKPISNVDSGAPGESGQQRNDAAVPVLRGLSRTVESMKQEGKDVVVQLTPPPSPPSQAGIDYGQSNPDDSDMYTTRS